MKITFNTLITICFLSLCLWACSDTNDVVPAFDLVGTWEAAWPQGQGRTELLLEFQADSSFVWKISTFGVQPNSAPDDLNALLEYPGVVTVNQEQVAFYCEEFTATDFYFQTGPETLENKTAIYDNCTYAIKGDTLILSFTSYPADRPVPAEQRYLRVR